MLTLTHPHSHTRKLAHTQTHTHAYTHSHAFLFSPNLNCCCKETYFKAFVLLPKERKASGTSRQEERKKERERGEMVPRCWSCAFLEVLSSLLWSRRNSCSCCTGLPSLLSCWNQGQVFFAHPSHAFPPNLSLSLCAARKCVFVYPYVCMASGWLFVTWSTADLSTTGKPFCFNKRS